MTTSPSPSSPRRSRSPSLDPSTVSASADVLSAPPSPKGDKPKRPEFAEDDPLVQQFHFTPGFRDVQLASPDARRINQLFIGLDRQLATLENDDPFEANAFTQAAVETAITDNIGHDGRIKTTPKQFGEDLTAVLADGLAEVRLSEDPVANESKFLNTVAQALANLSVSGGPLETRSAATVAAVDQAINILFGTPLRADIEVEEKDDFDVSAHVDELFGVDLQTLAKRDLALPEIQQIRKDFDRELLGQFVSIDRLKDLRTWVQVHVDTPSLKAALLNDINNRLKERATRQESSIRGVPRLIPLSATKSVVITKPLLSGIANELRQINVGFLLGSQKRGSKEEVRTQAKSVVDELNAVFLRHNIREGSGPGTQILRIKKNISASEFVSEFNKVIARLGSPTTRFSYSPNPSIGVTQDTDQIIKELHTAIHPQTTSPGRTMLSHGDMVFRLGLITVHSEPGKPVKEIVIPPHAIMANVMRLAVLLLMEPGTLEDRSGMEMLKITAKTTPGTIVSFIQQILRLEAGREVRLMYTPDSPVGGSFLSSLGSIILAPIKVATGLVGAAAGAVGSLLGGQLPQPLVFRPAVQPSIGLAGAAKPLFLSDVIQSDPRKLAFMRMPINTFTRKKGGAIKVSQVSSAIGAVAGGAALAFPPIAIVAAPIAAVASVVSAIGSIFGF